MESKYYFRRQRSCVNWVSMFERYDWLGVITTIWIWEDFEGNFFDIHSITPNAIDYSKYPGRLESTIEKWNEAVEFVYSKLKQIK